jgi:hypothetical protein
MTLMDLSVKPSNMSLFPHVSFSCTVSCPVSLNYKKFLVWIGRRIAFLMLLNLYKLVT